MKRLLLNKVGFDMRCCFLTLTFVLMSLVHADASGRVIGVSWANLSIERWKEAEAAIVAEIQAAGDTYVKVDAQSSASKQIEDIRSLVSQGVDAIIIQSAESSEIDPAIEAAVAAGIPIVGIDSVIKNPSVLYVGYDQVEAGRIQAKALLENTPQGDYVFIKGPPSDPNADLLLQGQMEILRNSVASGSIRIAGEITSDGWVPQNAQKNMEQFLTANDNKIGAVLSSTEATADGAIAALAEQGLAGSVPVSGTGVDSSTLNRIALGTQTVSVWKDDRKLGRAAADLASKLAAGTQIDSIESAKKWSVGSDGIELSAVLLEPMPITRENLTTVIEAGWVSAAEACKGVPAGTVAACDPVSASPLPVIDVCFASDRKAVAGGSRLTFSHERIDHLAYGFARVSIPQAIHEFGRRERPEKRRFLFINLGVETEDARKHFVIQEIQQLEEGALVDRSKQIMSRSSIYKNHVLLFIHGFNVGFDDALYTAAQVSWDMNFDGLPCIFSWPSKAEMSLTGYNYDTNSAQQSRNRLAHFLKMLSSLEGAEHISIVAHSMGNLALIEALREIPLPSDQTRKPYSEIVLAAPDLDRDNFLALAARLPKFASGVTLYASSHDKALIASKELFAGIPRAGDVPSEGPVVVSDIDSIDASAVSDYAFGLNHSYFATDRSVVTDIARLIRLKERPPIMRDTTLRKVIRNDGGFYWQFPD